MTPAELLTARAELLLGEAERQGKGPSFHHLDEIAVKSLPELSPEDRRAAVMEAQKIANRQERTAPPPGYKPSKRANGKSGRAPVAARRIDTAPEVETWTAGPLREFTRKRLEADPTLTAGALYKEAGAFGRVHVTEGSYATAYVAPIRRELGISPPGSMKAVVEDARREALQEAAPTSPTPPPVPFTHSPQGLIAPEAEGTADAQEHRVRCSFCGQSREAIRPSPAGAPFVAGPGGLLICTGCVDRCNEMLNPPAPAAVSTSPGLVEISGGGDSFRACRREDGGWDVELRAHVDAEVMDRLAGVLYGRVVGRAMEARA